MTVGETLTEARNQAGLSVDELSERTRIRGTIIRSIEQDDYQACGGDLYVRGYVRAIAGAVGIDAQPLIREYDEGRATPAGAAAEPADTTRFDLSLVAGEAPAAAPGVPPVAADDPPVSQGLAAGDPADTRFDLPPITDDMVYPVPADAPAATGPAAWVPPAAQPRVSDDTRFDLPPVTEDLMDAGYDLRPGPPRPGPEPDSTSVLPALGADVAGPPAPGHRQPAADEDGKRRRTLIGVVVIVLVLAGAGLLGLRLAGGGSASRNTAATGPAAPAASASVPASATAPASAAASASPSASASTPASASPSASASTPAAPSAQPATTLAVASAAAFGPDGTSDGDNPARAGDVVSGGQAWSTQWYTTPSFGMLKKGTGLLLSLHGTATVTSVRLYLSPYRGARLQLRAGSSPQDLRTVATASNAGGEVKLNLKQPASARYLLVWFTKLPPDGAGHYAEKISRVVVTGHR